MKTKSSLCIVGASLCLVSIAPVVLADNMAGFNMLYQPAVDVSQMTQNNYVGWVGGIVRTSGNTWPFANELGFADPLNQGLQNSHVVELIDAGSHAATWTVTIPAGTAAPWYAGYRWVTLPTAANMWYSEWYRLVGHVDGVDNWGDVLTGPSSTGGQISWDMRGPVGGGGPVTSVFGQTSNDYRGGNTAAGWVASDYGSSPTSLTQGSSDTFYGAVNMAYDPSHAYIPSFVPEPASLSLLGLGAALALALRRKH
jgi:hypothetical protein